MKRQEKIGFARFFTSQVFLLFIIFIAIMVAFGFGRAYYQNYKVMQEIKELENEVSKLEKKKLESMEILEYVISHNYVEDKARTELNMKQPGEKVIFINNLGIDAEEVPSQITDISTVDKVLNNPIKWWYYFTHKSIN